MRQIALIDGNNFFVSCERVFRPDLVNRPVIVLSSNDGCAIARSNEAKTLGISMGEPWFRIRQNPKYSGVIAFSSNFALYADMSNRFMSVLAGFSPVQEVYSIDECFLDLTGFHDVRTRSFEIRETVNRLLGLPVCVGVGPTKTLAKLANFVAKKHPRSPGVFNLNALDNHQLQKLLSSISIEEVWGIGRRLAVTLRESGFESVWQLREADSRTMRSRYGVTMERLIAELRGETCITLSEMAPAKKQILSSRSFGKPVTELSDLQDAITFFSSKVCRKLRAQGSVAAVVQVFIQTDRFGPASQQHHPSIVLPFPVPTCHTPEVTAVAVQGLSSIFRPGYAYKRAGVCIGEIAEAGICQMNLFVPTANSDLMDVLDRLNERFGTGTIRLPRDDPHNRRWASRQDRKSPGYTTNWHELPECS